MPPPDPAEKSADYAWLKDAPAPTASRFLDHPDSAARIAAAVNPGLLPDDMARAAADDDATVRSSIAQNTGPVPDDILVRLAADPIPAIRSAVANRRKPSLVVQHAIANQDLPTPKRTLLVTHDERDINDEVALKILGEIPTDATIQSLDVGWWTYACSSSPHLRALYEPPAGMAGAPLDLDQDAGAPLPPADNPATLAESDQGASGAPEFDPEGDPELAALLARDQEEFEDDRFEEANRRSWQRSQERAAAEERAREHGGSIYVDEAGTVFEEPF